MFNTILKKMRLVVKSVLGIEIRKSKKIDAVTREIQRLSKIPPNQVFETSVLGKPLKGNSAGSFLFIYRELFKDGTYDFATKNQNPFIIDCGVNVGLSIIYFKQRYPNAEIIGFEPDDVLFALAQSNLKSMGFTDVNLLKKGVWKEQGTISFFSEGTDAGRIAKDDDLSNLKTIETVKLSDYITRSVDFLKIDIEGAELAVLEECADKLQFVNQMFVEYHSFVREKQNLSKLLSILESSGFRYNISTPKILNNRPYFTDTNYLGIDFLLNIYAYR